jgi:hypothetical protein
METMAYPGRLTLQAVTAKGNKGTLGLTLLPGVVVLVRGELSTRDTGTTVLNPLPDGPGSNQT